MIFFLVSIAEHKLAGTRRVNPLNKKDLYLALPKSPSHESVSFSISRSKEEGWIQTLTFDPKPTPKASSSNEILQIELDNASSCVNLSLNWR